MYNIHDSYKEVFYIHNLFRVFPPIVITDATLNLSGSLLDII